MQLSDIACERLAVLDCEREALIALGQLADLLDPAGDSGRWTRAGMIAARLQRFESTSWPRIRRGHREPQGTVERLLSLIAASSLPRSRRKIWSLLG